MGKFFVKLFSVILLFLASSVYAVDCPGGTSTTFEWVGSELVYTTYVTDSLTCASNPRSRGCWIPGGVHLGPMSQNDFGLTMCEAADVEALQREDQRVDLLMCGGGRKHPNPESVQPAFPEGQTPQQRRRRWHRRLLRESRREKNTLLTADCLVPVWDQVNGRLDNASERRSYWGAANAGQFGRMSGHVERVRRMEEDRRAELADEGK